MSIANQITRIQNEVNSQEDLINQIATALQGKASGIDTSDATATASDILNGKTAYVKGSKVTGNIPTKTENNVSVSGANVTVPNGYYPSEVTKSVATTTQATPTIEVDSNGLITASATQEEGYVSSGNKSSTKQLLSKGAKTYTPSTNDQTIAKDTYLTGTQTIKGDSNLVASNIKSGVSIFGVNGTYKGSGGSSLECICLADLPTTLQTRVAPEGSGGATTCYLELDANVVAVMFILADTIYPHNCFSVYWKRKTSMSGLTGVFTNTYTGTDVVVTDVSLNNAKILRIRVDGTNAFPNTTYALPIRNSQFDR